MLNSVAAVLFDLDGTLIEHTRPVEDLCCEVFARFEEQLRPISCQQFWDTFWPKSNDMWYMMTDGVLNGDVAHLYSFVNTLRALGAKVELGSQLLECWEEHIVAATRPSADAHLVLDQLRAAGLRLGIVTNGYTRLQRRKARRHGLDRAVDFLLVSEEAGAHKPEPAIFDLALARAGVPADQALFVGDTLESDIMGARNAGLHAILFAPPSSWREPGAPALASPAVCTDIVSETGCIRHLGELLSLLRPAQENRMASCLS